VQAQTRGTGAQRGARRVCAPFVCHLGGSVKGRSGKSEASRARVGLRRTSRVSCNERDKVCGERGGRALCAAHAAQRAARNTPWTTHLCVFLVKCA